MKLVRLDLGLLAILFGLAPALAADMPDTSTAPAATRPSAVITLATKVEDGQKEIFATVTVNGKPLENANVSFSAPRTFGKLILGTDQTLDDGTAAIAFPSDLPGDAEGNLNISAEILSPAAYAGAHNEARMSGGKTRTPAGDAYPRALWSPNAPRGLIAVIVLLVAGAWGSYLCVLFQLRAIRKGADS